MDFELEIFSHKKLKVGAVHPLKDKRQARPCEMVFGHMQERNRKAMPILWQFHIPRAVNILKNRVELLDNDTKDEDCLPVKGKAPMIDWVGLHL